MKREALNHTKMKRLCRRLNIPLWQGVGLLETLWHLTAKQAPRGDIGRLPNEDIAIGIEYHKNEGEMIEALVSAGWLDSHPEHRLIIHDWPDHTTDAIHMKLARLKQFFANGDAPKTNRLPKWEREIADGFFRSKPTPIPTNVGVSDTHKDGSSEGKPLGSTFVRTESPAVRTESETVRTAGARNLAPLPLPSLHPPSTTFGKSSTNTPPTPKIPQNGKPNGVCADSPTSIFAPSTRFGDWWQLWSSVKGTANRGKAETAFRKFVPQVAELDCFECTASYLQSLDNPARGYHPENFLMEQSKEKFQARWPASTNGGKGPSVDELADSIDAFRRTR